MRDAICEEIEMYLDANGIELTDEEMKRAIEGVEHWLSHALSDAVAESVHSAQG